MFNSKIVKKCRYCCKEIGLECVNEKYSTYPYNSWYAVLFCNEECEMNYRTEKQCQYCESTENLVMYKGKAYCNISESNNYYLGETLGHGDFYNELGMSHLQQGIGCANCNQKYHYNEHYGDWIEFSLEDIGNGKAYYCYNCIDFFKRNPERINKCTSPCIFKGNDSENICDRCKELICNHRDDIRKILD